MSSFLLFLAAALVRPQEPIAPLDSGLVRSVELDRPSGTWAQYLRLDRVGVRSDEAPLGLLLYVAGPIRDGGTQVDLELHLFPEALHIHHSEQAVGGRLRMVFREVGQRSGRTLYLEGTKEGGFDGHELGVREVVRHGPMGTGELPLLLIESARTGLLLPKEALVLDPLAAHFEPLRFQQGENADGRTLDARRIDGSLRWRVRVRGQELTEWRFQERGPIGRPITREEYGLLLERHRQERSAYGSAAEASGTVGHPSAD